MAIEIPGSPDEIPEEQDPRPAQSNPYLALLPEPQQPAPAPQEPQANPYAAMLDEERQQGEQALRMSFEAAALSNPATAREAQTIARQLGIPPDNAERNLDVARIMLQRQQLESRRIELESPILARQLRDPEFAKMALDDWDQLGIFERTAAAYRVGRLQDEKGKIGSKFMVGLGTDEDERRLTAIDEEMKGLPPSEGFIASGSEIVGGMVQTGAEAIATGLLFGAAAAPSGPAAPLIAPAAFGVGAGSVLFARTAQVEAGSAYLRLTRELRVDPATARWVSMGVGTVNGALELVGVKYIAAPFKATIAKVTAETLADALIKPTIGRAAGKAAVAYVKGTGAEVATEVMQEVSNIVAEGSTTGDWEGVGKRLGEVAIKTAQGMALLGLPGPGMLFAHESSRVEKAKQSAVRFQDMQDKAAASNLKQGNPEAFQGHAEEVLKGTGAETVWMHASDVEEVLRQGGGTPDAPGAPLFDDLDKLVPGFSAQVRAEAARGGDIVMPSAVFLAKLTGTKLGDALTPHVRFAEADMSPHEAELAEPEIKEQEKAVVEQAADIEQRDTELEVIETKLTEELTAAGRAPQVAAVEAQLWSSIVRTQTEKGEQTPAQFVAEHPLRVLAGEVVQEGDVTQFAGWRAKGAPKKALGEASRMQEAGATSQEIHAATGWSIGPTGDLRFEISDDAAKLKDGGGTTLGEVLDHPKLFKAYPQLAGVPVRESDTLPSRVEATYDQFPATSEARRKYPGYVTLRKGLAPGNRLSFLLHEIQHAIQDIEGVQITAYGGLPYRESAVEVEARNVQMRSKFDAATRKEVAPERTEDVPRDEQIALAFDPLLFKKDSGTTQGFYRQSDATIFLTKAQDSSTFVHELWHRSFDMLAVMAQQKVSPQIVDDFNALLSWFGVTQEQWGAMTFEQREKHLEAFARSGEIYLWEGKAPTPELESVFARIAKWMREVYGKIAGAINAQYRLEFGVDLPALTPEVRAVMGRIMASAEAVKTAQTIEGAVPTFQTQEESGLNDEQWAEHQKKQQAAEDKAIAELTARSLGNMQWLSRAKGKRLSDAQKAVKNVRDAIRGAVAAEVQAQPVYRASRWLKTGEFVNADGTHTVTEGPHKIRTEEVAALGAELPGMTKADGLSADAVALMFEFETGEQLVTALREAPPINDAIDNALDAKMDADHSDLADAGMREAAVDASLHSEASHRFTASELQALTKSLQPQRITNATAKEAAKRALEKTTVRKLGTKAFTTAERKASIEAERAAGKSDTRAAIQWKRKQLVQGHLADLARAEAKKVEKAVALFDKFDVSDKKVARSRDIDLVNAARVLAAAYGLGPKIPEGQRLAQSKAALEAIQETAPVAAGRLAVLLSDARAPGGLDYRNLTVEQFREVVETGTQLWDEAKAARTLDAEGKKLELATVNEALAAGIAARPPRPPRTAAPAGETPSDATRRILTGWQALASLKRVEHWARFMDGGKDGPFQRYLVAPIMRAGVAYRKAQSAFVFAYHKNLDALRKSYGEKWNARYYSKDLDSTFRGAKELVGAMLHAGTNKQKLLLGRKGKNGVAWGELVDDGDGGKVLDSSRFDRAIAEAFDKGWLTKEAVEFVKFVHGSYAEHLPQAQKAHKAMFHYEFPTLEHNTIATPFGDIDGGYVPARADRDESAPRVELGNFEDLENDFRYSSVPGNKHFTMERNPNYNQPLILDLGKQLSAIDEEMRFIYLQPTVKDALRIVKSREFQAAITPYDRDATNFMLMPWLDNTARQTVSRPSGSKLLDIISSWLRQASSLTALGFSVINAAIQATGLSGAKTQVQGKYLRAALIQWARHPIEAVRTITGLSEFMRQRFDTKARKLRDDIDYMTSDKLLRDVRMVQKSVARGAFFLQRLVQGTVDVVTWQGGYAQAIAEGKSEAEAVEAADSAVRRAQGSMNPEDMPAYETGTPFVRLFGQFGSFSNVMLNQILGAQPGWDRVRAIGWALFVPALLEGTIRTLLMGGPDDDDGDGTVDEWAAIFGRNIGRNVAGLIPVVGPMAMALAESEGSRVQTPFGVLGRAVAGAFSMVDALPGGDEFGVTKTGRSDKGHDARALAAWLTLATGLPIAAPVRYVLPSQAAR